MSDFGADLLDTLHTGSPRSNDCDFLAFDVNSFLWVYSWAMLMLNPNYPERSSDLCGA